MVWLSVIFFIESTPPPPFVKKDWRIVLCPRFSYDAIYKSSRRKDIIKLSFFGINIKNIFHYALYDLVQLQQLPDFFCSVNELIRFYQLWNFLFSSSMCELGTDLLFISGIRAMWRLGQSWCKNYWVLKKTWTQAIVLWRGKGRVRDGHKSDWSKETRLNELKFLSSRNTMFFTWCCVEMVRNLTEENALMHICNVPFIILFSFIEVDHNPQSTSDWLIAVEKGCICVNVRPL